MNFENKKSKDRVLVPYAMNSEINLSPVSHKHLHIYYYSNVDQKSIQDLNMSLQSASLLSREIQIEYDLDQPPPVHLHIHSYGGDVYSGLAGASTIANCKVPVYTYVEGGVASAGTLLSMAGKKRYITDLSFMLIHQVSGWCTGNFEQIKDETQNLQTLMNLLSDFYVKYSKMKKKDIKKILKRDIWLSSEDCLNNGLVDKIIGK
jgi:ATP-dependent protease ClpP protease subunit